MGATRVADNEIQSKMRATFSWSAVHLFGKSDVVVLGTSLQCSHLYQNSLLKANSPPSYFAPSGILITAVKYSHMHSHIIDNRSTDFNKVKIHL